MAQGGIDSSISESMADLKEPSSNFWGQGPLSQRQAIAGHLLQGLEGRGGWAGDVRCLGEAREGKGASPGERPPRQAGLCQG